MPDPPDLGVRSPLVETWAAEEPMYRVHEARFLPIQFNPTGTVSRFRPFHSGGRVVSTLYAAGAVPGALFETVFREVDPEQEDQVVWRSQLVGWVRSVVVPKRDLELISLRGAGPRRLRTTAKALTHSPSREYPATARYAEALYRWQGKADGLLWDSGVHTGTAVIMLFGPRVRKGALAFEYDTIEPLWKGAAFEEVLSAAEAAGVTVVL